jgi:hypothetical protein
MYKTFNLVDMNLKMYYNGWIVDMDLSGIPYFLIRQHNTPGNTYKI